MCSVLGVLWVAICPGSLPALGDQINTYLCGFWGGSLWVVILDFVAWGASLCVDWSHLPVALGRL